MKKGSPRFFALLILSLLLCPAAFAAIDLGKPTPVAEALKFHDDAWVVIEGTVAEAKKKNQFTITDTTGTMGIEIEKHLLAAIPLKAGDSVKVIGKVDEKWSGAIVETEALIKKGAAIQYVSTARANESRNNTRVVMKGHIEGRILEDRYEFTDDTGTIAVEIDSEDWETLSPKPNETIELWGKVDVEFEDGRVRHIVEAKFLRKL